MEAKTTEHKKSGIFRRFVVAPFSIVLIGLSAYFASNEIFERLSGPASGQHEESSLLERMRDGVDHQLQQIRQIDARRLGGTFLDDLTDVDCDWLLRCKPAPIGFASPALLFRFGVLTLPSFHSLLGAPHALIRTSRQIARAGPWAVLMFITCAVFYFFGASFVLLVNEKDGGRPLYILWILMFAPLAIPILVQIIQWVASGLFNGISWVLGELVLFMAYGSALSVIAAIPHIWKAPREIAEATEVIRNV